MQFVNIFFSVNVYFISNNTFFFFLVLDNDLDSLLQRLCLIKNTVKNNIVKYYFNLNELFSILVYFNL